MKTWKIGKIAVSIELGPYDDSKMDLVVKSKSIHVGDGTGGSPAIMVRESSKAKNIEYWPAISLENPKRRNSVFQAAKDVLKIAEENSTKSIAFFTMGLEVARIPSWEIAEELVRALNAHNIETSSVQHVYLVASTPTQLSSFQFALNNSSLYISADGN